MPPKFDPTEVKKGIFIVNYMDEVLSTIETTCILKIFNFVFYSVLEVCWR